jgi:hypothetical protein
MCFNATASIIAFSIGCISSIYLYSLKIYASSIISFYLALIQLFEYFAHISIVNNDIVMNTNSSKLIFIFVLLQPILCYIIFFFSKGEYATSNPNKFLFIIPIYLLFNIYFYYYIDHNKLFKITHLNDSCKNICRLSWDFLGTNTYLFIIFLLMYAFISLNWWKKYKTGKFYMIYVFILTFIAIIYSFIATSDLKKRFSFFGSIWCFLSVTYGPFIILQHYLV